MLWAPAVACETSLPPTIPRGSSRSCSGLTTLMGWSLRLAPSRVERDAALVAADAGDDVGLAARAAQQRADGLQQLVAGLVAEVVVDRLEAAHVEVGDGERVLEAPGAGDLHLQRFAEAAAAGAGAAAEVAGAAAGAPRRARAAAGCGSRAAARARGAVAVAVAVRLA